MVNGPLHLIMTKLSHSIGKSSELVVTLLIKSAVVLHLCECVLHPVLLDLLNVFKHDLGDNQFGLPIIISIHISSFSGDVSNTVVKGDRERL